MTIKEYLGTRPMVKVRRGLGGESDWLDFCDLSIPSGRLYVMDPGHLPGEMDGCQTELPPGDYHLSGKVITYWRDSRISRLRIAVAGPAPVCGLRVGEVSNDHGIIGVADHAAYFRVWEQDRETFQQTMATEIPESGPCKVATLGVGGGVTVPFVESGFGDGTFEVHSLEDAGKRVGAEVVFIAPDQPYPF